LFSTGIFTGQVKIKLKLPGIKKNFSNCDTTLVSTNPNNFLLDLHQAVTCYIVFYFCIHMTAALSGFARSKSFHHGTSNGFLDTKFDLKCLNAQM